MRDTNPAVLYRDIAKKITAKVKDNLVATLEHGKTPDLYWKLEQAIVDALRYADQFGAERMKTHFERIVKDFEEGDGTSSS